MTHFKEIGTQLLRQSELEHSPKQDSVWKNFAVVTIVVLVDSLKVVMYCNVLHLQCLTVHDVSLCPVCTYSTSLLVLDKENRTVSTPNCW